MKLNKMFLLLMVILSTFNTYARNRFENDILNFEKNDNEFPVKKRSSLFVGSSSIRMWGSLCDDFPTIPVVNRGFGGSEVTDLIYFYKRIIKKYNPKRTIIYSGDNDLSSGKTPERIAADYEKLIWLIHENIETKIYILSIKPSPARLYLFDQMKITNELIERTFLNNPNVVFINTFNEFLNRNGKPDKSLYLNDGLHMTNKGYMIWKKALSEYFHQ